MKHVARALSQVLDPFLVMLVGAVVVAVVLPARGLAAVAVAHVVVGAIALLFFVYGARLAPSAVARGLAHWRLQTLVVAATFVLFPLVGIAVAAIARPILPPPLVLGLVFVSVLPSTVQSSIAFTSIARGNSSAALCSASVSNLLGMVVSPALVALILDTHGTTFGLGALRDIALQLLLPFVAGQLCRPLIGGWIGRHPLATSVVDRGSILIVVYAAFSEGMVAGIWSQVTPASFAAVLVFDSLLLAVVLAVTTVASRRLGFATEDEIAIVFCGSKKSMASGIPLANILFAGQAVSLIVLPLMLFHQIQLFVCATLARRYARRTDSVSPEFAGRMRPVAS